MSTQEIQIKHLPSDDAGNGWQNILPPRAPKPELSEVVEADFLVIGAGYAGLAAANRLAENCPDKSIVIVDAQRVGDGASGRSSGFVIGTPHVVGADLETKESALRAYRLSHYAGDYIWNTVRERAIDCGMGQLGQYMVARTPKGRNLLRDFHSNMMEIGVESEMVRSVDLVDRINTDYYPVACFTPKTLLLNPAAYVQGFADSLPGNVHLYENTAIKKIQYGKHVRATTDRGEVSAKKVILAVNGFAADFGHYKNRIFSLQLFSSLTRQLSEQECASLGGHREWGILPVSSGAGATLRFTDDRRLLIRAGFRFAASHNQSDSSYQKIAQKHLQMLQARFPVLVDLQIEHTWSGYISLSRNIALGFGQQTDNVYSCVCQNGVGLSRGTYSGLLAADLASGRENSLIDQLLGLEQPVKLPPRPFLNWGVSATLAWHAWTERGEA